MRNIIASLNELEKLKLLLFDSDQYYLFQHIPKAILYDQSFLEPEGDESEDPDTKKKKKKKDNDQLGCILSNNANFWGRQKREDKEREFQQALIRISMKKKLSVIDLRLLNIISKHSG